ncbi:MAG TPA: hypothetical protein VMR37_03665 [Rhabdochlamydiaceae bacterium]|nr:hypothetical protein [Rhabdochlamydiaceae bacterium]
MSTQFANSFLQGVQNHSEAQRLKGENEALGRETGVNLGGIRDPEMRKILVQNSMKKKAETKDLGNTFGTILDEMKGLVENVGPTWATPESWNPYSEKSGKRSQINTLRISLEGLFRDLTSKGAMSKAVYERVLAELPKADDTPQQYMNHIKGVEKILNAHFGEGEGSEKTSEKKGKSKFNPEHPEHKAKAQQLFKKFKDKERVRKELSREFEI